MHTSIEQFKKEQQKKSIRLTESVKQGKQYVQSGKLPQEVLDQIIEIDPTEQKKFVGWIAKQYIQEKFDLSTIKSYLDEFNTFLGKDKIDRDKKDINSFKTIDELKKYVDHLNNVGTASLKELESDFDVIQDDENLYIVSPNTHEASRKLGLTTFAHRNGDSDSAWCTTYKNDSHFKDYYYSQNVTFYYVLVKSEKLKKAVGLDHPELFKIAFAVYADGRVDAYDANDVQLKSDKIKKLREIFEI